MRLLLLVLISLFMALPSQAQDRIRNVRIHVADSSQLDIRYDLTSARPGDSVYLEVRSRLRGNLRILPEFVRGDVGLRITAGTDRRIIWDALANGYSLNEEIQAKVLLKTGVFPKASPTTSPAPTVVQKNAVTTPEPTPTKPTAAEPVMVTKAKPAETAPAIQEPAPARRPKRRGSVKASVFTADSVPAQPTTPTLPVAAAPGAVRVEQQSTKPTVVPSTEPAPSTVVTDTVQRRKTRYAGPAWALVSAVAPGIGNIFVQTPKPKIGLRPLLTVACYGLVAYGLTERKKSQDDYAIYQAQKNATEGAPYYQTANDHHHHYFLATRGAMVVAAADVILTFIKGLRNTQSQKEANRYQGISVRPGIQVGQPTAVVRYAF